MVNPNVFKDIPDTIKETMIRLDTNNKSDTLLRYYIKFRDSGSASTMKAPVGAIEQVISNSSFIGDWMLADGRVLFKKDYSELYSVIGDLYSLQNVIKDSFINKLRIKFPRIKFLGELKYDSVRTCSEKEFRIPDTTKYEVKLPAIVSSYKTPF